MKKNVFIAIIIIVSFLFSIIATIISIQNYGSNIISKKMKDGYVPVNSKVVKVIRSIKEYINGITHLNQIIAENKHLKEQLDKLSTDRVTIEEIKSENKKLKELLGLKNQIETAADYEVARVTLRSSEGWLSYFIIDKGLKDGIRKNMVVVNNRGLVGSIVDCGLNWAKVETLLDADFSASAMVVRTRDIGVVRGNLNLMGKGLCELKYVSKDSKVKVNDVVITSGMGEIFPKGIVIGKIVQIKNDKFELTKNILIKPAVDIENIEYVMVLKKVKAINFSVGVR
ncbi:rod shape-determining protein MreC [Caldicellulosiruptor saccharolyticus DSM 8903]|uniref:Cell shape-determining protein MreC n=1 Tax=Caldicellulosiruptor saccharolyticus (strain ATCC 43494 / DSM 8903 / Tp8T 6331) TaxID=351627 RepID=A4XKL7_CALS8|nr:rod shape-determining protein MreC [Caldicellulosiruptor saccharolyticus]ABP67452.1 rod shape-determining protein MreC [Caldicellulosiruptor saccharolyticus DSM 8903]